MNKDFLELFDDKDIRKMPLFYRFVFKIKGHYHHKLDVIKFTKYNMTISSERFYKPISRLL